MSHFAVLVVGDVDYNMEPFDEFECTGEEDEFVQTIDETEGRKKDYLAALEEQKNDPDKQYGFKGKTFREYLENYCGIHFAESAEKVDTSEGKLHKYGYFYPVEGAEDDFKVFRRTNPNSFYDYYGEGYHGFKLKKPIKVVDWKTGEEVETMYTNHALKKDIDFAGKWAEREASERALYQKVVNALGYVPRLDNPWASLVKKYVPEDGQEATMTRDEALKIYNAQQPVIDFNRLRKEKVLTYDDIGFYTSIDDFCMSEDEYVASKHIHALTWGYVINREYHSKGHMGWWAMSWDEKDPNAWDKEYEKFINSLPDDAELTILDCHV